MSAPAAEIGGVSSLQRLLSIFSMVRYRFFLYAGLLPYLLGSAWGYATSGALDVRIFLSGLGGVVLSVIGVEAFNEYFDSRMGTDRVFNPEDVPPMSSWVLWLGIGAFAAAFAVGVYLTLRGGWPIFVFALAGGMAAIFYVAPPIRWAYRGLGELVIALSYGPWMVLGSVYLYTGALSWGALIASLVPGLLIMALAVVNAIPDFHQDRLVGKRNLVVRLGRARAVRLYVGLAAAGLAVVPVGVACGLFPMVTLAALLAVPLLVSSARSALHTFETPRLFVPAIRSIVRCYLAALLLFIGGILLSASPLPG
jgi:1,4-dihydroxy-2-naphthoate polyprenyltransferase